MLLPPWIACHSITFPSAKIFKLPQLFSSGLFIFLHIEEAWWVFGVLTPQNNTTTWSGHHAVAHIVLPKISYNICHEYEVVGKFQHLSSKGANYHRHRPVTIILLHPSIRPLSYTILSAFHSWTRWLFSSSDRFLKCSISKDDRRAHGWKY